MTCKHTIVWKATKKYILMISSSVIARYDFIQNGPLLCNIYKVNSYKNE